MAKTATNSKKPRAPRTAGRSRKQVLAGVTKFYQLGKRGLKETAPRSGMFKNRHLADFVETTGLSSEHVQRAIRFAELYNAREFRKFCQANERAERPLGVAHICQLVQVANAKQRAKLTSEALQNGWTRRQLQCARQERYGLRDRERPGGRPPKDPISLEDAHGQLRLAAQQLLNRMKNFQRLRDESNEYRGSEPSTLLKSLAGCEKSLLGILTGLTEARQQRRKAGKRAK